MKSFLLETIKEAGEKSLKFFKKDKKLIRLRGQSKEITTKYDKFLDEFIVEKIQRKYPNHSILSEEGGLKKKNLDYLWIIDSLDGSSNFANCNPFFSISIALMIKNEIVLASVFAPALGEFYFAQKDKGAFLNGKRIKVSQIKNLNEAYIVYCEGNEKDKLKTLNFIQKIFPQVKELRKIGSAGIETSWVAAGKVDGYFTTQIDPWDVTAGVLIVKEAGGEITDFKGRSIFKKNKFLERSNLLFSNSKLHQKILKLLKK